MASNTNELGDILDASDLRAAGAGHKVTLTLKIRRYNPELRGEESWWDEFEIQTDPDDRLLDALHQVKWYHDGTLALRRSCAHGICGSDAMMIDGKNALACKVIVRDVAPKVTVEPIRGLPVKDISVAQMLDSLFKITRDFDMPTQPHLLLLQKTMVMVEGVATALDPQFRAKPEYLPKSGATESASIKIDPLGRVLAILGSTPQGQGHQTIVAQIVADELGVTPADVTVVDEMDTFTRPWSMKSLT